MDEEGVPPSVPNGELVGRLRAAGGEDGRLAAELIERLGAELARLRPTEFDAPPWAAAMEARQVTVEQIEVLVRREIARGLAAGAAPTSGQPPPQPAAELIERQGAELARLRPAEAELIRKEAETAALREEIATLHGKLAHGRAGTQPEAGGHGAQPGFGPSDPEPSASTGTMKTMIQTVGGAAPPPDFEAGALRDAAVTGDLVAVQRWLQAGIDPNAPHELLAGWTPLHYAAQLGHVEIIGELLDHGAHTEPLDRFDQSPLMQAGYWGCKEAEDLLKQRGGGETRPTLVISGDDPRIGRWDQAGYVTILCSAPEWSLSGDNVMKALEGLCAMYYQQVKFGYDWCALSAPCACGAPSACSLCVCSADLRSSPVGRGGSSTAEPSDANPDRQVRSCCHSLACTCTSKGVIVCWNLTICCGKASADCTCSDDRYGKGRLYLGAVNWRDAMSVAGQDHKQSAVACDILLHF